MTNEELIDLIRADGDRDNSMTMKLWDQNTGLIHKACNKFRMYIETEDAEQECFIAFMLAVNDYDPAAGMGFASFLSHRLQWHLIRQIETVEGSMRIPIYQRTAIRKYRQFCRQWYQANGKEAPDYAACYTFGLTRDQLDQLKKDSQAVNVKRLDAPLADDVDSGTAVIDTIQDMSADVEGECIGRLFDQERQRAVWSAVDSLDQERQREVIRLYYRDRLTYQQISERIGLSTERVRQILLKGLRVLRTHKRYKVLREFIDLSPTYSLGIRGGIGSFTRTWTSATEYAALKELKMQNSEYH